MSEAGRQRLDKWLWHARLCKTRSLAARLIADGRVRVDGVRAAKASLAIGPGQTLTLPQGDRIRVVEVTGLLERRGPAAEAQAAYVDHTPPPVPRTGPRPTGRDRRRLDAARGHRDDP